MKVARLYTRRGDAGTTGLLGPERVSKDDPRIEAIGAIDELNAVLGVAIAALKEKQVREVLLKVQDDLFTVGAELARPGGAKGSGVPRVTSQYVSRLERAMADLDVGRVSEFVVPHGPEGLARLHWARAVARRAERRVVTLSRSVELNPHLLRYMNRLSSLMYQMAVWAQKREHAREDHPTYRA